MAAKPALKPSFSPYRKWRFGLQVGLILVLVLSVVVMINYASRLFFPIRFHWSRGAKIELAPLTVNFLHSLTNRVRVILYYDKKDEFYTTAADLLNQYKSVNSKISVETVDYLRDAGAAQKVGAEYKLSSARDKNLIIFDCEGKSRFVPGNALAKYVLEQVPNETDAKYRRKPAEFLGQRLFTGALLAVTSPKPLRACFLRGHGEHSVDSKDENNGYFKLAAFLAQNYIAAQPISLLDTNAAPTPSDCSLLIIAGPTVPLADPELEKIDQYLSRGGRLLALFRHRSIDRETGLEKILARWGVDVGRNQVVDPEATTQRTGEDVAVGKFSEHPAVNALLGSALLIIEPRSIARLKSQPQAADAPRVEEIAFTGPNAFLQGDSAHRGTFPLMAAVEKGAIKGVVTERGTTRMIVVGDSIFLANGYIDVVGNRDFAGYAVNWLLDRTQLLGGIGPQPITEYRNLMTASQLRQAEWILLAGMPGGVLLIGGLVWLRRRK